MGSNFLSIAFELGTGAMCTFVEEYLLDLVPSSVHQSLTVASSSRHRLGTYSPFLLRRARLPIGLYRLARPTSFPHVLLATNSPKKYSSHLTLSDLTPKKMISHSASTGLMVHVLRRFLTWRTRPPSASGPKVACPSGCWVMACASSRPR